MSYRLLFLVSGIVGLAVAASIWGVHSKSVQAPPRVDESGLVSDAWHPTAQGAMHLSQFSQPAASIDPRAERRKATDYQQLVNLLLPLANASSPEAQYALASTLHYCDEMLHGYFTNHSTGTARTLEDAERAYAKLPYAGLSNNMTPHLIEIYQRCHALFVDPKSLRASNNWLDRAARANNPAAIFMQADLMRQANLLKGDPQEADTARSLAIEASATGDPDAVFGMIDFVSGTDSARTPEETGKLMSAWELAGCERGFDCSAQSEWINANCTSDPQCANKPTVVEELQRIYGAKFGEVQQIAEQIGAAIDSHDPNKIKKYL